MARTRKGTPHQAKHFQPEDHAHAAHQQEARRGHLPRANRATGGIQKDQPQGTVHPTNAAPRGPKKGQ
jgi:hypothetical protein